METGGSHLPSVWSVSLGAPTGSVEIFGDFISGWLYERPASEAGTLLTFPGNIAAPMVYSLVPSQDGSLYGDAVFPGPIFNEL
jgi:hypothetical protein